MKTFGRWTRDKNGKPVRDGDKVLLPPAVFDALAAAAEAADGVRYGSLGNVGEHGNPSGCLLGLAVWIDGCGDGAEVRQALRVALTRVTATRGIPSLNDSAFTPAEQYGALPFDVLCQRAGIDIDSTTRSVAE